MNMKEKWILPFAICFSIIMSGCVKEGSIIKIPEVKASSLENPKYSFASLYNIEGFSIKANAPQYKLPLLLDEIENGNKVVSILGLSKEQLNLLQENGFVVIPFGGDDIIKPYNQIKRKNIPIFITSDTLLHIYHIQFNELLKNIEEREFFNSLLNLSKAMFEKAKEDYAAFNGMLKEAARRNVAYFCVALKLLDDVSIPKYVKEDVEQEIKNIEEANGFAMSSIFKYEEDYSQYKPRGHYTQSEKLQKYFKAMMWYGRMAFLMKGGQPHCKACPFLISEEDSNIATIQAALIAAEMPNVEANGQNALELWKRMYSITSFFVGLADDLTPYEYLECLRNVFGEEISIYKLVNETNLLKFKAELLKMRSPRIYGGTGNCEILPPFTKEKLYEVLNKTKGMRFMGQRFLPDSYMFQQLVSPAVGMYVGNDAPFTMEITMAGKARCFPRGLDVIAVLGSDRALEILEKEGDTEYEGENTSYYKQIEKLRNEFEELNATEWNRNLYWSWLYALKALLKEFDMAIQLL